MEIGLYRLDDVSNDDKSLSRTRKQFLNARPFR